jgi:hypothetical protein
MVCSINKAHPKKNYATLRSNPINRFELGQEVFGGTYATGETALPPGAVPKTKVEANDPPSGLSVVPVKRCISKKAAQELTSDIEEEDVEFVAKDKEKEPPKKRVRDSKFEFVKQGVESIVKVLRDTAPQVTQALTLNPETQAKPKANVEAIQKMASMFLPSTLALEYVK